MAFRPGKCLLPDIMRERKLEPYQVYTDEKIDMSRSQFSDYYTGRKKMSTGTLKLFAEYFGLPMDDIYVWIEIKPRKRSRHQTE